MAPLLLSNTSAISSSLREALPLPPLATFLTPEAAAMRELTAIVSCQRAGAGTKAAAGICGGDAGRSRPYLRRNQRALGVAVLAHGALQVLGLPERGQVDVLAQVGQFVLQFQQSRLLRLFPG